MMHWKKLVALGLAPLLPTLGLQAEEELFESGEQGQQSHESGDDEWVPDDAMDEFEQWQQEQREEEDWRFQGLAGESYDDEYSGGDGGMGRETTGRDARGSLIDGPTRYNDPAPWEGILDERSLVSHPEFEGPDRASPAAPAIDSYSGIDHFGFGDEASEQRQSAMDDSYGLDFDPFDFSDPEPSADATVTGHEPRQPSAFISEPNASEPETSGATDGPESTSPFSTTPASPGYLGY